MDKLYFISKCVLLNSEKKFLLLKRNNYKNDGTGGLWDIPGGSVNLDEDVNSAIRREVREELQVEINKAQVFHIDSGKGIPSGKDISKGQFIFVIFVSTDYDLKDGIKLSHEHSEYRWISAEEMKNYKYYLNKNRVESIRNYLKELGTE